MSNNSQTNDSTNDSSADSVPVSTNQLTEYYDEFNNWLANPVGIIVLVVIVGGLALIIGTTKNNKSDNVMESLGTTPKEGNAYSLIIVIILGLLFAYLIINFFQYFLNIDIWASLTNIFEPEADLAINVQTDTPTTTTTSTPVPEIKFHKQVFNIPQNTYTYPDAKALCTAYGAELATYSQIEDAYNKGAEWCNYGWSDEQMAYFPTQQKTFDNLQEIDGHENDCGRPGINGGFMANPALKFGANCYGYKPKMTSDEEELMNTQSPYPLTKKDVAMQNRVDYWKDNLTSILVSPFNYTNWSKI